MAYGDVYAGWRQPFYIDILVARERRRAELRREEKRKEQAAEAEWKKRLLTDPQSES